MAQYREEFLKGRSQAAREEFMARPLERQYSSIIQWRRNKRIKEATPRSTSEILETLVRVGEMIGNAPQIEEQDSRQIAERLTQLQEQLAQYMEHQKVRRIEALEQESRRISEQLQQLRGW